MSLSRSVQKLVGVADGNRPRTLQEALRTGDRKASSDGDRARAGAATFIASRPREGARRQAVRVLSKQINTDIPINCRGLRGRPF